jgi:hypothetical protein
LRLFCHAAAKRSMLDRPSFDTFLIPPQLVSHQLDK